VAQPIVGIAQIVEDIAAGEHHARATDRGRCDEGAAAYLESCHGQAPGSVVSSAVVGSISSAGGSVRFQPVMIERSSLIGPAARIITMWMRKKATSSVITTK